MTVQELIAARNYGGAWQKAEEQDGPMSYTQFLAKYVWLNRE